MEGDGRCPRRSVVLSRGWEAKERLGSVTSDCLAGYKKKLVRRRGKNSQDVGTKAPPRLMHPLPPVAVIIPGRGERAVTAGGAGGAKLDIRTPAAGFEHQNTTCWYGRLPRPGIPIRQGGGARTAGRPAPTHSCILRHRLTPRCRLSRGLMLFGPFAALRRRRTKLAGERLGPSRGLFYVHRPSRRPRTGLPAFSSPSACLPHYNVHKYIRHSLDPSLPSPLGVAKACAVPFAPVSRLVFAAVASLSSMRIPRPWAPLVWA